MPYLNYKREQNKSDQIPRLNGSSKKADGLPKVEKRALWKPKNRLVKSNQSLNNMLWFLN